MRLVQRVAHSATWGERIARHHQPTSAADFGPRLFRRFDAANAPGQWANTFAQRFVADEMPPSSSELTLAPHAPAQRQVSAARQGALGWSGGDSFSSPASSFGGPIDRFPSPASSFGGPIDRLADADASQSLIGDLMGSGWGVRSTRPDTLRRSAESAGPEPAPSSRASAAQAPASPAPIHRSPAPTAAPTAPAQRQSSEPIRRTPEAQPATPTQTPATINRQADAPAAPASDPAPAQSSTESASVGSTADSSPVQRSADSAASAPSATTSAAAESEDTPPIETAGTRPMTFFRGTPQSPLMRMGLSESSGSSDAPAAPATINRQPASGDLPVVRPARGSDEPSLSATASSSGAINRRAEQTPAMPSPQITSSNSTEHTSSSDAQSSVPAAPEIQREAIDTPAAVAAQPEATASDSARPEVQRQAAAESSAPVADSTIDRSASAAPTTAADTTSYSTVAQAPVQRSAAPTSITTAESAQVTAAPASVDSLPAASSATAQPTSASNASVIARSTNDEAAPVQRTAADTGSESSTSAGAEPESSAAELSAVDAGPAAQSATPMVGALAQRSPVIHRQPVQPARASSIDTVLPLATRLLQRYSAGSSQGTSGSMPLLRTFAPTTAAVMRSAAPLTSNAGPVQSPGTFAPTGTSSAGSTSVPPLVHRSPIVPLLPTATVQREPAIGTTASAATPAPRATAPALEWSALPLLQRLSSTHALPATPASSPAASGASVAAQVINRLALDQPGAAPMPLLRMHAPSIARTADAPAASAVMRTPGEASADRSSESSSDAPAGQNITNDDASLQGAGSGAQSAVESSGFGASSTPAIHRSAIVPSLTSAAFQPLTLLRVHVPDAPSMAQADAAPARSPLQRSSDTSGSATPSASPIMMRSAEQPSLASPFSSGGEQAGNEVSGASSAGSTSIPPLVHRSPIVPLLPTATVQREPASGAISAAAAGPRAAAPALEWSALPLLQRLNGTHALPATPAASASAPASGPAASGASVAAQVINRLALDQPGASPMPLLRMHAPLESPILSRESAPASAEAAGGVAQTATMESQATQPSVMSSLVRRSAILPPAPSFAAETGAVGAMASQAAQPGDGAVQRSPAAEYALPMLQRTSVQRFFGSRPGLRLPSLGGIQNSVNSLAGQAQGMVNQVTGLPGQLQGQAQGMIDQVTGMPNQLMGQAQGMINQVTGMPSQLMGQAQGMINQVTGMSSQLMGQAQGMIDQVTGMPSQLMGQAQGMIDQVTGMPNQLMGQAQGMINQVTGMPNQLMGRAQGMIDQVTGMPSQMQNTANNLMGGRATHLTLLRPTRGEAQSASMGDERNAESEARQAEQQSGGGAGASTKGEDGKHDKPDMEMLAQQVYARLRHRLLIDRERLGR
ncbi:MAG TPA: hypothetical protein VGD58_05370 [Herpetosiphonaceae bacterium]